MEYSEHFEELYLIRVLEHCGAEYRQQDLLHKGKKGSFYACTILLYDYVYQAVSYVSDNHIRYVYKLLSVSSLRGEEISCKDIFFHMERNIRSHKKELSADELLFQLKYSAVCIISGLLFILSFVLFIIGIFVYPFLFSFAKAFSCIIAAALFFLARIFFVRFRRIWFGKS